MNPLIMQWAARNGVSLAAVQELSQIFGMHGGHPMPIAAPGTSESAVQSAVRLEATKNGVRLFRNNVGVLTDERGTPVRYGLANDSKSLNQIIKSADLIGWRTIIITPDKVGQRIAQFVSRECKAVGWHYTGDAREKAQLSWAELVTAGGGDAAFCTGIGTLDGSVNFAHTAKTSP